MKSDSLLKRFQIKSVDRKQAKAFTKWCKMKRTGSYFTYTSFFKCENCDREWCQDSTLSDSCTTCRKRVLAFKYVSGELRAMTNII